MKHFAIVMGAMFLMTGCGKKDGEAKPEGDKAAEAGPAACELYTKATDACIAKLPEADQAAAKENVQKAKEGFKSIADKGALETACKTAIDEAKKAHAAACPDVAWE
jgi:hypothetical protein